MHFGVPQGSVLAPHLFILYLSDHPDTVSGGIKIFADDSKLFRSVRHQADSLALQQDLGRVAQMSREWQLNFNVTKCKVLHLGRRNGHHVYTLDGMPFDETEAEKDMSRGCVSGAWTQGRHPIQGSGCSCCQEGNASDRIGVAVIPTT